MKASEALTILHDGNELRKAKVTESIRFYDEVDHEIHCTDCHFEKFDANFARFKHRVVFKRCTLQSFNCYAAYFYRGLHISACEFGWAGFQSGGHNAKDCNFEICDSIFHGFADFLG